MATRNDVDVNKLIDKTADMLKESKNISPPAWAGFVKTGMHKERPPAQEDWWYVRCAALLRSVANLGPVGVNKLRTKYGGKKDRGHQPPEFRRAGGSIIRHALQQLEKDGLIKQDVRGNHKGRVITPAGVKLLDSAASSLYTKYVAPKVVEGKEEKRTEGKKEESHDDKKAHKKEESHDDKKSVKKEEPKEEKKTESKLEGKQEKKSTPNQSKVADNNENKKE